ncbi:MAG TPA: hypothetical protein DHW02_06155 [Ktedonobacter sp.]|nr:hypothetical protein [Ktedonobacter sp.]
MQAEEILTTAKANVNEDLPHGWVVLPLLRQKLILAMVWWVIGMILGFVIFSFVASVAIPYNYTHGPGLAIFSTLVLAVALFVGLGSLFVLITDIRRLQEAKEHVIVLTPDDIVKQEGKKVTHVPLLDVLNVTARGTPPPDRKITDEPAIRQVPGSSENMLGFVVGRGAVGRGFQYRRSRMRTPTTLAFIDARTNKEVVILNDGVYGDPFTIAELLRQYVDSASRRVPQQGKMHGRE